jgi:hypothetical protein
MAEKFVRSAVDTLFATTAWNIIGTSAGNDQPGNGGVKILIRRLA